MKTTSEKTNPPKPKSQTQIETEKETEKEKENIAGLENLYSFRAGASCGLYSMGEEYWEKIAEKINPNPQKEIQKQKEED
ncbi:MAG: hypothetical protein ACUVXA_11225 [Candidatus Jordarchaeum sp.]|uniref:hypothetical protein n=1 Tax=Candidatus Jordarchaeum sp. TaxID=2823881 RepID=UPI004049E8B1